MLSHQPFLPETLAPRYLMSSKSTTYALLIILLLAAALRLARLDLAEFKSDEAGIVRQALALVHEGRFPAVGPSSSQGPAHPPPWRGAGTLG